MISSKLFRVALAALFAAALSVSAPVRGGDKDKKETVITEKEDKGTVKVKKGTDLLIKLDGQPSTGYTWTIVKNNEEVLKYAGKVAIEKVNPPVIGGKVKIVLRFTATSVGNSDVELGYRRPFEKDKAPAKLYKVKVEVTE